MRGRVCHLQLLLALASAVILRSESLGAHNHIWLPQIQDSPNLGQVPVFIFPSNRVAQLYPHAMGSLFVASYDSQGYDGGIRTRLHAGITDYTRSGTIENTASNSTSIVARGPLPSNGSSTVAYLRRYCLAMTVARCMFCGRCLATGLYIIIQKYFANSGYSQYDQFDFSCNYDSILWC
jgi:hypothetical protein